MPAAWVLTVLGAANREDLAAAVRRVQRGELRAATAAQRRSAHRGDAIDDSRPGQSRGAVFPPRPAIPAVCEHYHARAAQPPQRVLDPGVPHRVGVEALPRQHGHCRDGDVKAGVVGEEPAQPAVQPLNVAGRHPHPLHGLTASHADVNVVVVLAVGTMRDEPRRVPRTAVYLDEEGCHMTHIQH